MDNLTNLPNQNTTIPPQLDSSINRKFWSKKKIISICILIISIIIVSIFLIPFFGIFTNLSGNLADIQGGREANYWELDYIALSGFIDYPDICNKIYEKAYITTGGGFTGKPLSIKYIKPICLTHESSYKDYLGIIKLNPLNYMGYSDQDIAATGAGELFLEQFANTEDFKSRLSKLPNFSSVKNDAELLASSLQCPRYSTSYISGIPEYIPNPVLVEKEPCCADLNEDKICDQVQPKHVTVSAEKISISMSFEGQGFISSPSPKNMASPDYIYVGYLIKNEPFKVNLIIKNNDIIAIDPIYTYLSLWTVTDDGERPINLFKYKKINLPALKPGESTTFNFDNLIYKINTDWEGYHLYFLASMCSNNGLSDECTAFPMAPGVSLRGFSSKETALKYK